MRAGLVGCGLVPDTAARFSFFDQIPTPDRGGVRGASRSLPGGHHV